MNTIESLTEKLNVLRHPLRNEILFFLKNSGEANVTSIYKKFKIEQPSASHHLSLLKRSGLVSFRRNKKEIYYFVKEEKFLKAVKLIEQLNETLK